MLGYDSIKQAVKDSVKTSVQAKKWTDDSSNIDASSSTVTISDYDKCIGFKIITGGSLVLLDADGNEDDWGTVTSERQTIYPQVPYQVKSGSTAVIKMMYHV